MKYIPLQGQPCKLYEIQTLTVDNPVNYLKYISLQGQPCKSYMDIHGNYMKYIPLQGQRDIHCKL